MPVSNCIGFVLGLPLLVINREACHADRAYAMRHLFMACRVRCILPQFLTLLLFSFILFVVFFLCTFCTDRTNGRRLKGLKPKYQRARHTGKIFTNVLCSGHICEPSVGRLLSLQAFGCFQGAAELAPRGYLG